MAEEVGLTINDVELSFLDAPNQVTAFETKAIDAAYAVEPWVARFTERGVAVRFPHAGSGERLGTDTGRRDHLFGEIHQRAQASGAALDERLSQGGRTV